jgi:hypothetical protein
MGGSQSKETTARQELQGRQQRDEAAARVRADEEAMERLLRDAYRQGAEEAAMSAKLELEQAQTEYGVMGALAVALTIALCYVHGAVRMKNYSAKEQEKNALVESQTQQLALERQRVLELVAVNDASREVMQKNEVALQKLKQQHVAALSKARAIRMLHRRLQKKHVHLSIEVKNLRGINGTLNQRFIASTSGAIFMACVAAGFALSSHGSSSHGAQSSVVVESAISHKSPSQPEPVPTAAEN